MSLRPQFVLILAILLVPLVPLHFPPMPSFHAEWVFAMVAALGFLLVREPVTLTGLKGNPLVWGWGLLTGAALLFWLFGWGTGPQQSLMPLYCVFGAGLYVLIRSLLASPHDASEVAQVLAAAVLFSGLLACLPAACQLNRLDLSFMLVFPRQKLPSVVGNIAQANKFADWLWLSILAAAYLAAVRRIGMLIAIAAILPLAFFAVTTGSRSVWLYPVVAVLTIVLFRQRGEDIAAGSGRFIRVLVAALIAQGVWQLLMSGLGGYDAFGLLSSIERVRAGIEEGENVRQALWLRAIGIVSEYPWLGVGVGGFRWAALQYMTAHAGGVTPVGEHAHNLFLHLAAEFGVPVAVGVLLLLMAWGLQVFTRKLSLTGLWGIASLAVIGVHSMLEYPLWNTYFMGLAAMFVALVDREAMPAQAERAVPVWAIRGLGVAALAILAILGWHNRMVESAFKEMSFQAQFSIGIAGFPVLDDDALERLDTVPSWSPFRSYAEAATVMGALPDRVSASAWLSRCERVARYDAKPVTFGRCAMVNELAGDSARADQFARWGCIAFPRESDGFISAMQRLSGLMAVERTPLAPCLPAREPKVHQTAAVSDSRVAPASR